MLRILIIVPLLLLASCLSAQKDTATAQKQFDFWTGDWSATWSDTIHGDNKITKEYDGLLIHERFSAPGNYLGQSYSIYNLKTKVWEQTWVDNQGGYMLFSGGMRDKEMILDLQNAPPKTRMHMRFTNITLDAYDWYWESSKDDGKSWQIAWLIHYKKKG